MTRRFDSIVERGTRSVARRTGRRAFLARLGAWLVGATAWPLLPIARARAQTPPAPGADGDAGVTISPLVPNEAIEGPEGDPTRCEYWRYCAIDGSLCSCCGGTATACPPGTEVTPVTWVGTCRNPADGKHYLVSYNDCCGRSLCGRCVCNRNEGERPEYHWYRNNDINWCAGSVSTVYNCSIAVVIGEASEAQPER
ncbi:MAG TPA: methylamine dehydrogenase light chain [Myxococcota bacterium]|nr:methylamine dehydrogenase light chain [Myxococcota bacterium]